MVHVVESEVPKNDSEFSPFCFIIGEEKEVTEFQHAFASVVLAAVFEENAEIYEVAPLLDTVNDATSSVLRRDARTFVNLLEDSVYYLHQRSLTLIESAAKACIGTAALTEELKNLRLHQTGLLGG